MIFSFPRSLCSAAILWSAAIGACCAARVAAAEDVVRAAFELREQHAAALAALARWCDEHHLPAQAAETREHIALPLQDRIEVNVLSSQVRPPLENDAPADVAEWHRRYWELRETQATADFALAKKCLSAGHASLAFQLVLAAARENPDDEATRRALGYQRFQDGWYTSYEVRKLRAGQVWSDRFGWLPKTHVARYEQGQRYTGDRWISAEEDARRHREILSGWDVETEHYTIRTDHSIEAAVALGVKLERLHRVWRQLFVRYFASEATIAAMLDGRARPAAKDAPRLAVVYFRDREDYNRALREAMPGVELSVGVYVARMKRAYFFASQEPDDRTLYHEATHQLFHQSRPVAPDVGRRDNFWIIEGVAMFMESLRQDGARWYLGGNDDVRMDGARHRLLVDDYYVPFDALTARGMEQVQRDPHLAALYSQMAGMTHFLIFAENARYRDALVEYLMLVYSGRDQPETLAQLTGTSFADLDREYRAFVAAGARRQASREQASGNEKAPAP